MWAHIQKYKFKTTGHRNKSSVLTTSQCCIEGGVREVVFCVWVDTPLTSRHPHPSRSILVDSDDLFLTNGATPGPIQSPTISNMRDFVGLLLSVATISNCIGSTLAWLPVPSTHHRQVSSAARLPSPFLPSRVLLQAGGFGGGGGSKGKKSKSAAKLKPKAQWDRFLDMKGATRIPVAVSTSQDEWLKVGNVRSKENAYTELAVARQRALIAEVRLQRY